VSRVYLQYSRTLTDAGTFFLLSDGHTVRCNLGEAESRRYVVELPLRRSQTRMQDPRGLHVRPLTSELEMWLVESSVVHEELARMELVLTSVPPEVATKLLAL
jgi:hypothetical protein